MRPTLPPSLFIIDQLIRSGHVEQARQQLQVLSRKKARRDDLGALALLAWRVRLGGLGVKWLNPIVRPPPRSQKTATSVETAVYAACLTQVGALDEAEDLLRAAGDKGFPQAVLFQVSSLFARWEYGEAIPLLERFVESPEIDDYQRIVGNTNLAAALVYEHEHDRAARLLNDLSTKVRAAKLNRVYGNLMELSALNAILNERWKDAESALSAAEKGLGNQGGIDAFLIRKWKAVLQIKRTGDATPLDKVRNEALDRGHWETVRDCDHIRAVVTKNRDLLIHVYYGTPFPNFRRKLLLDFGGEITIPSQYLWSLKEGKQFPFFDLATGADSKTMKKRLKLGQASHRLLKALCSDFYRPLRTASLHSLLYPGDFYNPVSAPLRVRQAVKRLREWAADERLPLKIVESDGAYRLEGTKAYGIQISEEHGAPSDRQTSLLDQLRQQWPSGSFSAREAEEIIGQSGRTVRRVLEKAVAAGTLTRDGQGSATRYTFTSGERKAA